MSYNGSGTFQINSTGQPVVSGTVISSTAFNALTADLATGLSTAITKDGQTATTARIPFAQGISSTLVTDSTSTTTGSIITAGGAGVAKALFVGTTANVAGAVTLQSTLGVTGITTFSAQPIFSSLTASSAVATDASKGLVSVTNTGTGNNVLATSPTLVTPVLGAASATSVTVAAGAVGTPSITTAGDTNTGIFFPAADTIAFAEGGAEAVRIDSSANVGIGTTSPVAGYRLNVVVDSGNAQQLIRAGTNFNSAIAFGDQDSSTSGQLIYAHNGDFMAFNTNAAERMRIDSSGNVGIATSSPAALLDINGSSGWAGGTTGLAANIKGANSSVTQGGNLRVLASTAFGADIGGSITLGGQYTSGFYLDFAQISGRKENATDNNTAGYLAFATRVNAGNTTEAMRIDSSGNLLVGATAISAQGEKFGATGSGTTVGLFKTTGGATNGWAANFWNNATSGNNLFVEFASETSFTGRGSITYNRAGGLTVYNTTSDERLKQNIVDAPSALSKISSVQIRSFDWKETGNHVDFGVIAQELKEVAPEAVTEGEDNEDSTVKRYWGVDTSALVPALVKAIQEQQALITALTTRITALENK